MILSRLPREELDLLPVLVHLQPLAVELVLGGDGLADLVEDRLGGLQPLSASIGLIGFPTCEVDLLDSGEPLLRRDSYHETEV